MPRCYPFSLKHKGFILGICHAARCKKEVTINHVGVELCDRHWNMHCNQEEIPMTKKTSLLDKLTDAKAKPAKPVDAAPPELDNLINAPFKKAPKKPRQAKKVGAKTPPKDDGKLKEKILEFVAAHPRATYEQVAKKIRKDVDEVRRTMRAMARDGELGRETTYLYSSPAAKIG